MAEDVRFSLKTKTTQTVKSMWGKYISEVLFSTGGGTAEQEMLQIFKIYPFISILTDSSPILKNNSDLYVSLEKMVCFFNTDPHP